MNNGFQKILHSLFLILWFTDSSGQELDSVLHLPKNQFFYTLINNNEAEYTLAPGDANTFINIKNPILQKKDIVFIKNKKQLFAHFSGTSRVYKYAAETDSSFTFSRLDNVENINYNINSYSFIYKNILYNYGGYGFWRSNGFLRKFNEKNKEWDIVPLNKEIHSNNEYHNIWKAPLDDKLYILFEHNMNEGIKNENKNLNKQSAQTYTLDLSTNTVEKNGKLNDLIIPAFLTSTVLHTHDGVILSQVANAYYLKPKENKIYSIEDPSLVQTLVRAKPEHITFFSNGKFHIWNIPYNKYDSVDIKNIKLKPIGKIWTTDTMMYYFWGAAILIFTVFLFFILSQKKPKQYSASILQDRENSVHIPLLSETEIALINLLIEKSTLNEFTSSNEINYIIGCKDKNVGLQKKMRSDIINSINTKYKAHTKTDILLIESGRTDYDKRYFHYQIPEDQVEKAKLFIELTAKVV